MGGGRASIVSVSFIIIGTFALYPAAYFRQIATITIELIIRIINLINQSSLKDDLNSDDYIDFNAAGVLTISIILFYFCYNYRFEHFKETARLISVTTIVLLFLILS